MTMVNRHYLEPLVRLALSNSAQEVSAGLADAACCRQHGLPGLHAQRKPSGRETALGRMVGKYIT